MFCQDAMYSRRIFLTDASPARGEVSIPKGKSELKLQDILLQKKTYSCIYIAGTAGNDALTFFPHNSTTHGHHHRLG